MKEIRKYLPELEPKKLKKNVSRWWRINVNPPKETKIFAKPEDLPLVSHRMDIVRTRSQPKQVVYDSETNLAYVSCMQGNALQTFSIKNNKIELVKEIQFEEQCVEVALSKHLLFVTTTNFARPPYQTKNRLHIFKKNGLARLSSVDTGGNWSKVIAIHPFLNETLVSNWESQDISVIDFVNPKEPFLRQTLKWGKSPRGMAFTKDGNTLVLTGYYSGNLGLLNRDDSGTWSTDYTSEPYDFPNYSGNMRHVILDEDGDTAIISNMGRNLIHYWSIGRREFLDSTIVGKFPNTICFLDQQTIAVSCRKSNSVYLVNKDSRQLIGISQATSEEPTGLCAVDNSRFLSTGFKQGTLELQGVDL